MTKKQKKMLYRIIAALALVLVLKLLPPLPTSVELLLYCIPYLVVGWDVLRKALLGIKNRQPFDECFLMAVATVGAFALVINVIYSIILLFMGLETSFVVAIFGHALPSSILTGLVAIPFLMSGVVPQSGYGFSARGGRQTGMRFKPKTRKLK